MAAWGVEMKKSTARLNWNLWTECPHCGGDNDLAGPDFDCEGDFSTPIFSNKWDDLKGHEVECDQCHQTFQIEEVEY